MVGGQGVLNTLHPQMSVDETEMPRRSAQLIRDAITGLDAGETA
jgi:hypothetical protein